MVTFTGPGTPLSQTAFDATIGTLGCDAPGLWALLAVETQGCGFLPDRRPKILFERHFFSRLTKGQYDASHPDISNPSPGGYGAAGAHQYDRLAAAIALDQDAALQSASWGLGQIMGANHAAAGYADAAAMVAAFVADEGAQLAAMAAFIVHNALAHAVAGKDWAAYARGYNGPNYAENAYDTRLAANNQRFVDHGCPDIGLRAGQVYLVYRGYDTGGIDGVLGPATTAALNSFQASNGLPQTGQCDAATLAALAQPA